MANGFVRLTTGDGVQRDWQLGDYAFAVSWKRYRLRVLRTDWSGTVEVPQVRVESQTEREGHRFSFWATYEYDPTPDHDGLAWGFRFQTGEIAAATAVGIAPRPLQHSWDLRETLSGGEAQFHRDLPGSFPPHSPAPIHRSPMYFGGRALMSEKFRGDSPRSYGTIFVTDESWRSVEWNLACTCCGGDVAPIDTTTGKPLEFGGDRFCLDCWRQWTAEAREVDESEVTPPTTIPRFVLLHAGVNAAPTLELVDLNPATPLRSAECGVYNFATQSWTCSNLRLNDDGRSTTLCGARTAATNPTEWTGCSGCNDLLILL